MKKKSFSSSEKTLCTRKFERGLATSEFRIANMDTKRSKVFDWEKQKPLKSFFSSSSLVIYHQYNLRIIFILHVSHFFTPKKLDNFFVSSFWILQSFFLPFFYECFLFADELALNARVVGKISMKINAGGRVEMLNFLVFFFASLILRFSGKDCSWQMRLIHL